MKINPLSCFITLLITLLFSFNAQAQSTNPQSKRGIYIIFDASGSMWGKLADNSFKIHVAKQVLQDFVQTDLGEVELAFRAYGHNRKGDCRDSELLVPFGEPNQVVSALQSKITGINPVGKTPITYSFKEALKDFDGREGDIILISDGIETCDEDPCELVKMWNKTNVNIKVHVVGLGLDEVSKPAMQCIADASGTDFHGAESASDLAEGLKKIQEQTNNPALIIEGLDANNEKIPVEGVLFQKGQEIYEVSSHQRNQVAAGDYLLMLGVRTQNGNLYRPVRLEVNVSDTEDTKVSVKVITPPSVKAKFIEDGQEQRGALIYAFQNGEEVFRFRWMDEVFVDEGTYEFRTQPNADNALTMTENFAAGDHKELVFKMVETVHVYFKMLATQSGIPLSGNYRLLQNGEVKYKVHRVNGSDILPGIYDVELVNDAQPFIQKNVQITTADDQKTFTFEVPVGHVTFRYQNADGSPAKDKRCFAGRDGESRSYHNSGKKYPYRPGIYQVEGWKGNYDLVTFEVKVGEDIEVVLREKQ